MKIFITGINGFLGCNLASHWLVRGGGVCGSARHACHIPGVAHVEPMSLGEPFAEAVFDGIDAVVHMAHDFTPGAMEKNVNGTKAWLEAAARRGVRHQILLSSYSARADAESEYGKTKYRLEQVFLNAGQTVLRPGLVMGNGGLFAKQRASLLRTPVMPILGRGDDPVALIGIGHFLECADAVLNDRRRGAFHLFYEKQPTMREYIRAVKQAAGQHIWFVPVSIRLAEALVRSARALRIRVPIEPSQIRAVSMNRSAPWKSDLPLLLPGRESEFTMEWALPSW